MKKYILIAGVNGAGKSTLYQSLQSLQSMPRVNTDEILREFGDWRNVIDVMTAGKIAVKRIATYFDEDITFNQETTLCGKSILNNITRARKRGYFIELHYIGVENVDIAKERVALRVKHGGHGIAEKDIERRYIDTFNNLKIVLPECDLAAFYDNTIEFRRFAIYKNGRAVRVSHDVPMWYTRFTEKTEPAEPPYKTIKINNRRYLGNKYKLLSFITRIAEEECSRINTVADIFAGTGAVASAFTDKKLITNDIMYSNYICHLAWFGSESYSEEKIIDLIAEYNAACVEQDNYMSDNFADTYFSREDCRKIGFIRQDIEDKFHAGEVNGRERALVITSLLYAMDKIANTCGHYDAYRQGVEFDRHLELAVPQPDADLNENNICYNMDTNELAARIEADLVYIDPPYNSRQYCDAYHLLENVARWDRPEVFGVARKMDRTALKSDYCTKKAAAAFENLIDSIHAKYIILSYNNMAEKGNDRSNAKISDDDIMRILQKKGAVKVFSEDYKAFSTGKSDIQENQERLFLCTCYGKAKEIIPSALNYTGGKYKLLPQILPLFPQDADQAVDLFCGGCNVGINVECSKVWFNDTDEHLIGLLNTLKKLSREVVFSWLFKTIDQYGLSLVSRDGYEHYGCESSKGLGAYNAEGYYRLRKDFNDRAEKDDEYYLMLYLLIIYSFNNQLRFNRKGEFNLPVGKRDFNSKMQEKLAGFLDRLKSGDYRFTCGDFRDVKPEEFTDRSFFYVDPPYLITCATYNEQGGWTRADEKDLLDYLEELDRRGIRFALSNVLESKGKRNDILADWIEGHRQFKAVQLAYDYSNSNYQTQKSDVTREVLVINY